MDNGTQTVTERAASAADLEQLKATLAGLQTQVAQLQQQVPKHEADSAAAAAARDTAAKLERLNFYRREDAQEWTLLTNRVNSYIMSQAFLVAAYATSMGNPDLRFRLIFPLVVAAIGITASARAYPGIDGACKIIQLWHRKKEEILTEPCLADFCDGRQHQPAGSSYHRLVARLVARSHIGRRARQHLTPEQACAATDATAAQVDEIHVTSLYFSQSAPKLFGGAWVLLLALALTLHFVPAH
jgi:hypothetical protein